MELPSDEALRWMVSRYASLRAAHGEAIGDPTLVQPTADFFPDEFRGDAASVLRLWQRMVRCAPIADDLPVQLAFVAAEGESGGGCGSPACDKPGSTPGSSGSVQELDEGYRVLVAATDLGHPDVLAASLARGLGSLVLCEGGQEERYAALGEVAAVACGFGVLLANGAAVWAKGCGGLKMARATVLSVEELATALAIFASLHAVPEPRARAHLRPTQKEAFDLASTWTASNPALLEALRDRPASLREGVFDFEPPRGLIGRWLRKRALEKELRAPAQVQRTTRTEDQKRRMAEARALVDEVFDER